MPYRRRRRGYYARRSARFRRYRRRRRRARVKKRGPSTRVLARKVRAISKRLVSAKKMFYTVASNVLVENNVNFVKLGSVGASDGCLTDIPSKNSMNQNFTPPVAYPDYQAREDDSVKSCVSSIGVRLSVHCSGPVESTTTEHYWIALCRTTVDVGSATGIVVPRPSQVWDPSDTIITGGTSLLPLWRMFKPNIEYPEIAKHFKILKVWTGTLQPQQGPVALETDWNELAQQNNAVGTDNPFVAAFAGGDPYTNTVPGAGTFGYCSTIPSFKQMHYTHNMKNEIIQFDAATSRTGENVKYYLLACGNNPLGSGRGYRVNATMRTVFYDT